MDRVYLAASTVFFLGGFIYIIIALRTGEHHPPRWNLAAMVAGFVLQSLFLYERGLVHRRCPITNVPEILIFIGWAMVLIYLLFGSAYRLSLLGFFTSPIVFAVQLVGLLAPFDREAALAVAAERGAPNALLELHIAVSLLAYGAFAMACVAGVMFLVQDRLIRRHQLNALFYNLPPIRYLSNAIIRLLSLGLVLLTIGIATAYGLHESPGALKLSLIYGMWVLYAAFLALFWMRGMAAATLARASVLAFLLPLISVWVITLARH
jgi:HemX protein